MLKKSSLLIAPYNSLYHPQASVASPIPYSNSSVRSRCAKEKQDQWQTYATVHTQEPSSDHPDDLPWPRLAHSSSVPSPYQIFQLRKNAPYSKRRFYELVKLYHPDRSGLKECTTRLDSLSGAVKMERYRLVVAANDILSDPSKRKAYDKDGTGWNGRPDLEAVKQHWGQGSKWSGFDTNDSPFRNATWEDWERWYQRNSEKNQEPVYFSNGGFLTLVIVAVSLGAFGQSLRLDDYSNLFQRKVEQVHDDASKVIRQRRIDSQAGDRDQRLQSFLKTRDPLGYGTDDLPEEQHKRI